MGAEAFDNYSLRMILYFNHKQDEVVALVSIMLNRQLYPKGELSMSAMLDRVRKMIESGKPIMPIAKLLGFSIRSVDLGQAVIEIDMTEHHVNTMGTLHGGVLCTIADTAMGVAFATMLEEGEALTTLELKINYLKPVWKGKLLALGKVVKKGKTTGLVECDILDEHGQLIARASSTYMAISGEQAKNRTLPT
jgi:uncharacterized protein (TIGR00369 family)